MSSYEEKLISHPKRQNTQFEERASLVTRLRYGRDVVLVLSDWGFTIAVINAPRALMDEVKHGRADGQ